MAIAPTRTTSTETGTLTDATRRTRARAAPQRGIRVARSVRDHPERWIIAAAILVRLPLVFTGITNSSDIWRQSDTASIARNFSTGGFHLFFPQIDWGGAGPGYVESEFQLYPFTVGLLYKLTGGEHVWLGKLVSLVLTTGTLAAFWGLARRVVDRRVALLALGFFAFSPIALRYGDAFMPEATVLCFYVLALLLFVRWLTEDRVALLVGAGLATGVALLVKPTSIQIGAVLVVLLVADRGWRALLSVRLGSVAVVAIAPAAIWTLHARDLHLRYGNTFGVISGGDRKFATLDTFTSSSFYTGVARIEVVWVFAVGALPLFLLGLVVAVRRRSPAVLLAGTVVIPIFFAVVAKYSAGPQGIQYHVFALPYAALGVGLGLDALAHWSQRCDDPHVGGRTWSGRVMTVGGVAAVAVFALVSLISYVGLFPAENRAVTACARHVADTVPAGDLVVASSPYASQVDGYDVNFQEPMIFYFSDRRGWSLAADRHTPENLTARADQGARWFLAYDGAALGDAPDLQRYLDDHAEQVGPGLDAGCGIWRLPHSA